MGMKAIFQNAAKTAFALSGDIKVACTYVAEEDDGIDATTGPSATVEVVFGEFSVMERNNENVMPGDATGLVLVSSLPVVPKRGHTVTRKDTGMMFSVIDYTADPVGATYRLHLRGV